MIKLGDPVPWFSARDVRGAPVDLHVDAGRWVVLAFFGAPDEPRAREEFAALLSQAAFFDEDRLVVYCIFGARSIEIERMAAGGGGALVFVADYDGDLARRFGAWGAPRTIVLDPILRAIADIAWDHPAGHAVTVAGLLRQLPAVDDAAGVPMTAPVLIVPRVLDFEFCDLLVALYDKLGGDESGFLLDSCGKTATVIDHRLKRRQDMIIALPDLRETIRDRFVTRLLPAISRYFQFEATRMDRYLVSCYDSALGGHFFRHRDNINAGAAHRRFAVTINLNKDYDGCDLVFPEFGRRAYRAPVGGAVVFSCGALHEVTPITRGRRYAFIPFLYGEDGAARRKNNNARLHDGEAHYLGEDDRFYPLAAE
jgi:peroxiredoxin